MNGEAGPKAGHRTLHDHDTPRQYPTQYPPCLGSIDCARVALEEATDAETAAAARQALAELEEAIP